MKTKVFVALSTFGKCGTAPLEALAESGLTYDVNPLGRRLTKEELIVMGRDSTGVVAGLELYDEYVLGKLSQLRCISRCGVGIDNIALKEARARGVVIFNTTDVVIQPVAELAVGMAFDLLKRLSWYTALVKAGRWERKAGNLLNDKKIGILGLGKIGKRTAEIMSKLAGEVYGADITPDQEWAERAGIQIVSVNELLKISDILSIHLSYREDNPFQLDETKIAMMKKGALLINVSRGRFVDEEALYNALSTGYLGGAALDVYEHEPYIGKLRELDNIVLTPHTGTLTKESRLQMELEATRNLINFLIK